MWERELRGGLKRLMPFWLHILLILKQKSKRVNVKIKFRKDLSNSTMGKMSIKKPQFRERVARPPARESCTVVTLTFGPVPLIRRNLLSEQYVHTVCVSSGGAYYEPFTAT